jgi:uncharacterized damage-inducible protein DinB
MRGVAVGIGVLMVGLVTVSAAQSRAGAAQPVSDAVRAQWETAKKNIHDSAVDVPEANYSFAPVPSVVRTFGQIVAHVAGANYEFCSAAKGEKTPKPENAFDSLATKTAIVKAWDDSVVYCDAVFKALTDRTASEAIDMPFGGGKGVRVAALLGNIGHLNEHYGNLVTYMRLKGIVPPSSRGR